MREKRTSLVAQRVKIPPAEQEAWVQSLGWETHSSILAWKIPWTEKPGRLQSMGSQRAGHDWPIEHIHSVVQQISRAYSSVEENYLSIIKAISDELTASNMLKGEKVNIFLLRPGTRQICPPSPFPFCIVLEVLARSVRQAKTVRTNISIQ